MPWILIIAEVATCMFVPLACTKSYTPPFSKSADERVQSVISQFDNQLTGSLYGWKLLISTPVGQTRPGEHQAFTFFCHFDTGNRVSMWSDIDSSSFNRVQTSSYLVKALQQPTLIFDTYSYLHVISDPSPTVYFGATGSGLSADFSFYLNSRSPDTIGLTGQVNGTTAVLVKATKEEYDQVTGHHFMDIVSEVDTFAQGTDINYLSLPDGSTAFINISAFFKQVRGLYVLADGSTYAYFNYPFSYSPGKIYLANPVVYGKFSIREFVYDQNKKVFYAIVNGNRIDFKSASEIKNQPYNTYVNYYSQWEINFLKPGVQSQFFNSEYVTSYDTLNKVPRDLVVPGNPNLVQATKIYLEKIDMSFNHADGVMFMVFTFEFSADNGASFQRGNGLLGYQYGIDGNGLFQLAPFRADFNGFLMYQFLNPLIVDFGQNINVFLLAQLTGSSNFVWQSGNNQNFAVVVEPKK